MPAFANQVIVNQKKAEAKKKRVVKKPPPSMAAIPRKLSPDSPALKPKPKRQVPTGPPKQDKKVVRGGGRGGRAPVATPKSKAEFKRLTRPHPEAPDPDLLGDVGKAAEGVVRKVYGGGKKKGKGGSRLASGSVGSASVGGVTSGLPFKAAKNVGYTLAKDPIGQGGRLLKDTGESIVGAPAGIIKLAKDPVGGAKEIAKDYERRYGDLLKGPEGEKRFRERLEKEGVAPEVFDIGAAATGGASAVGRGIQAAAKAGKVGKKAEKIATSRPAIRVSGGVAKEQPVHPNFARNVVRAGVDKTRKGVQKRRAQREDAPVEVREAEARGEVTHIRRGATKRAQRKMAAQGKGVTLARMKAEHQAETSAARKTVGKLSKKERRGFKYAMQYGIVDATTGRRLMKQHKARVVAERAKTPDRRVSKRQDELANIQYVIDHADEVFTPRLAEAAKVEGRRSERAAFGDPGVSGEQAQMRRYAAQAEMLGVKRADGESNARFLRRVKKAHTEAGLQRPGYFPSQKRPEGVFSAFAAGGTRAVKGPAKYTGALTRTGREAVDPEMHVLGLAKNIKRKHNWNMVADSYDSHAFEWSKGKTINELKDELEHRGIDPNSVAFWNPGKFKKAQAEARGLEGPDADVGDPTLQSKMVQDAVEASAGDVGRIDTLLRTDPGDFGETTGWSIIPKAVYEEIHSSLKPSGKVGRGYDIAKGKASRVLLANPAWLQFQIGSNALMTGLAGVGPVDAVKAQLWWRKLTPEEKSAIEPFIGVHKFYDEQRHLGAAANGRLVNAFRALKTTGLYQAAHRANPFDALFRADNAQNNFFRRAVFYNRVKREAYRKMGEDGRRAMALQQRIVDKLSLGQPDEAMRALVKDRAVVEQHAKAVTDFLGDWTTYTHRERRYFSRFVMFYGFVRFSTRLAFYTLPVEHPLMSSMLLQLGRLQQDELEKLFGEDVPPWEVGNLYSKDGKRMFEARRLNPFFNALQYKSPGSLAGLIPPVGQVLINQVAGKNVAFDQMYTTDGSTAWHTKNDIAIDDRLQIMLGEALKLSPYYRAAEKVGLKGKQSSDSSLLFPQPMQFKRPDAIARNEKRIERQSRGLPRALQEEFVPFAGASGEENIESAKEFAASKKKGKKTGGAGVPAPPSGGGGARTGAVPPPPGGVTVRAGRVPPPPPR